MTDIMTAKEMRESIRLKTEEDGRLSRRDSYCNSKG